ncbi:unnamed protein product [Mytilus edulis]|uniref:Uncharacterized protein n=1 Tax=Mytilus edulis TaxID=6550 RepID=A0A8S3Q8I3_MYTED|nr:unnamed protein product [Mytilus edulis]
MKVAVIVASAIFNYLLYCDVSQAKYSLKCPERSHWKIRANSKCKGDADKYHCLFDPNSENITEFCASPKDYTAGFMAVYRDYNCKISKLVKTQSLESHNFQCHAYPDRIMLQTNDRMNSISPCLSERIKKFSCRDRSVSEKNPIDYARTMVTISLLLGKTEKKYWSFADYFNVYKEKRENYIMNDLNLSEEDHKEILTILPKKLIDDKLEDKIHLYRCKLEKETTVVTKFAPSIHEFDTARRLTHVTLSQNKCQDVIFIADENDKRLTSIGRKTGQYIKEHEGQNRGLQNVRAIGATENRVYAATSAGISVFSHNQGSFTDFETQSNNSEDYRMLLDYKNHVEHTRSLCIYLDKGYIYVGLSCVIKQNDVIVIFRFKPNDTFE